MKNTLLAIGEALIDFVPDKKGCAFDEVTAFSPKVGGAPANVAGAFAAVMKKEALDAQATLLTALGRDEFGKKIEKELASFGVDTSRILFTDKANTALAFVSLAGDGNRSFSFYRNPSADMLYSPKDIPADCFDNAFALHFCSVSLGDFPMKEAHEKAVALAKEKGMLISFDPNLRFPLWQSKEALYKAVWKFLPKAHIVKLSDEELPFLTGKTVPEEAFDALFVGNVTLFLYTMGKKGACAFLKTEEDRIVGVTLPPIDVNTVDTTGAGDAFMGAFLAKLSALGINKNTLPAMPSKDLAHVTAYANLFAALSTEHYGALASYRYAAEKIHR